MAGPIEESKIIRPFFPSLFHIASVEVALSLTRDFPFLTLYKAYEEIRLKDSTSSEDSEENQTTHSRAKKTLLFIPAHLRSEVWNAYNGFHSSVDWWYSSFGLKKPIIYARYDGTFDSIKTAQHLVLNKNIDIKERFQVASNCCLEKCIQVLWSEMEASGQIQNFETAEFTMARFWSNRMRYGSQVPWTQALLDYIESLERIPKPLPRASSLLPFLQPKDRQRYLTYLCDVEMDDFRLCLYSLTKAEEEKILKVEAFQILRLHLRWPLRDLLLETAEKIWKFIDVETFGKFVEYFISLLTNANDSLSVEWHFDYRKLFVAFWQSSPDYLKEIVNDCPDLKKSIDCYLN